MRNPTTAGLLTMIGRRELQFSHKAFDALPPSGSVEHLREILVHHRMMPDRGDPRLARFERWLDQRLASLRDCPDIHTAIEQFARWHHLRRLRDPDTVRNMDNATRRAKQEVTEAGKFLAWLRTEHGTTISGLRQTHLDAYLSEGTSTRHIVRSFLQWRARAGIGPRFRIRSRAPSTTPLAADSDRLDLIRTVLVADHVIVSTRIAALLLLLYGIPICKICELELDDVVTTATGTTIRVGSLPAPVPEPLLPLLHEHLAARANQRTMNHGSRWLFPGTRVGHHITEQSVMQRLPTARHRHPRRPQHRPARTEQGNRCRVPGRPAGLHPADHEHPRRPRRGAHGQLPRHQPTRTVGTLQESIVAALISAAGNRPVR